MSVRRQTNRYRTTPTGYDYAEVLKRGKRFHRHDDFEMQPSAFGAQTIWAAESRTLPTFSPPRGTILVHWNGTRWEESPL